MNRRGAISCTLITLVSLMASCGGPPAALASPEWAWPVTTRSDVSREFDLPAGPYGAGHRGIDVATDLGASIVSPAQGVVEVARRVVDRDVVTIRIDAAWSVSFDGATATVAEGTLVNRGDTVAISSPTPHCACVHVGVRYRGAYLNPLVIWGNVPRAVLLPW